MRPTPETIPSGQEPVVSQGAVGAFANGLASPNALPIQRPNALVADDDPVARTLLVRLISSWGYDVVAVSDGDQAIQALEREDGPQLAVLDRMMDGADGIEVCQRVRSLRNSRYVYIILVTSRDQQADRVEGLSAGADDYLTKPFDPLELRARLETGSRICLQRALRESEMRFQEAIGCSGVGMALVGLDGNWTQVNQAFVDFFGYEKKELRTLTFRQLTHPKDLSHSEDLFLRLVSGEMKNFQIEKRYLHKKGHTIWGLLTVSLVKTHYGGPAAQMVAQIQDISKSKAAEQALQESEALFRAIAENADELIAVTDPRGKILYTSPAYKKHLGYETGELNGLSIFEHLHPDDRDLVRRKTIQAIETGESNNVQIRLRHKDGSWRTVDSHGGIIRNAQNQIERLVATSRIIDEWIAAQEILQEREEQLQLILDSTAEAIYGLDREGNCTFCNNAFLRLLGYQSVNELLGKNVHHLIQHSRADGSKYPAEECGIYQALNSGEGAHCEDEVMWRADGSCFPAEYWSYPVRKNGEIVGGVVTFIDITNRKIAEAHLREAHDESELVINSVPTILIGLDTSGRITQWNLAACETFALASADVRGQPLPQCGIKWLTGDMGSQVASWLGAESSCRVDNIRFQKDGETRLLGFTVTPVEFANKNSSAVLIIGADTTERKALEEQLRQAQKLEAIGQLAAGIAHEINTPTQFVGDNTTFVKDSWDSISQLIEEARKIRKEAASGALSADGLAHFEKIWKSSDFDYLQLEIPRAIDQSLEGIRRVANIVKAMKEFSHPGSEDKKAIDINHAIETTITVARNEWRYVADVRTSFAGDLPFVPCLAGEFNQAILNLIINAAHAIVDVVGDGSKRKGVITISTRRDGDWAEISIEDTGTGIPEAIKSRIFEPFFTTKDVGRGTGQGLTLAHAAIVKKHGGKIWFASEEGKGTTFFIRLPLSSAGPGK
jgi:two-component system, NtrC family, sensor kinase